MAEKETKIVPKGEEKEILNLIKIAIENKADPDALAKLYDLQREYKKDKAKEAFVRALTNFQNFVPTIGMDKEVKNRNSQETRYRYASLAHIVEKIKKDLKNNGLSFSWDVEHKEGHMKVTCKLTHELGHSETSSTEIPIVTDGYMTEPQKYASAQTYAKRYTLINILGITTADEDDDSLSVPEEKDAKSQKSQVIFLLKNLGYKTDAPEKVAKAVKETTGLELTPENLDKIVEGLEEKVSKLTDENSNL